MLIILLVECELYTAATATASDSANATANSISSSMLIVNKYIREGFKTGNWYES